MNIPMFVIRVSMILGGLGMVGMVVWWAMSELAVMVGWKQTWLTFWQGVRLIVFIVGGIALIVFGLGLE